MKEKLILFIKGFFIGIANIIPGVSGGTMAVTFGIYEKLINIASNIFKNFKENIKFLLPIILGAGFAVVILSGVISSSLTHFPVATPLFFIGLILGGFLLIFNKIGKKIGKPTNLFCFVLVLVLFLFFNFFLKGENNVSFAHLNVFDYIILFGVGIIASATMVIPGISGSFVLMMLGYYQPLLDVISSLVHFENIFTNIMIAGVFGVGVLVGIIVIARLIRFCLEKWMEKTYSVIIAFVFGSIFVIVWPLFSLNVNIGEIIVGILLMIVGALFTYQIEKK